MAAATGLIVANLYYCQPLIILIAKEFNIPNADAGTITYLTQAGAIGLFLMVPLGDKIERKVRYTTFCFCNCFNYCSHSAKLLCLRDCLTFNRITSSASTYFAISSLIERTRRTG
jgi:hypothetical protein